MKASATFSRVVDRRAEHDGLPISGLLAPVPDHLIGHRRLVHDRVDLAHVEVGSGAADLIEIVLDADVDHEGAGLDQMARRNELADPDLVGDIGEHLAQALAVAAIGRCGDTEDANHRIALQRPVDDLPITFGHRMVCFVDHQEIERRHGFEIGSARQGRHHREGDLALPRLLGGIDHRGGQRRIYPGELAAVLLGELVAVGQHTGLGVAVVDHLTGDGRQHDGLAGIVRDGEVAHQVTMVAIDRETIVLAQADRMRRKAGPQHVLFLAAGRRLFAQHAGWDLLDEAGQYDAPIEFAVDLLFAQVGHQAEAAGDERDLAGELPRVAAELEAATGPEVTVGVEKPCQDGKTRRTAANPIVSGINFSLERLPKTPSSRRASISTLP